MLVMHTLLYCCILLGIKLLLLLVITDKYCYLIYVACVNNLLISNRTTKIQAMVWSDIFTLTIKHDIWELIFVNIQISIYLLNSSNIFGWHQFTRCLTSSVRCGCTELWLVPDTILFHLCRPSQTLLQTQCQGFEIPSLANIQIYQSTGKVIKHGFKENTPHQFFNGYQFCE